MQEKKIDEIISEMAERFVFTSSIVLIVSSLVTLAFTLIWAVAVFTRQEFLILAVTLLTLSFFINAFAILQTRDSLVPIVLNSDHLPHPSSNDVMYLLSLDESEIEHRLQNEIQRRNRTALLYSSVISAVVLIAGGIVGYLGNSTTPLSMGSVSLVVLNGFLLMNFSVLLLRQKVRFHQGTYSSVRATAFDYNGISENDWAQYSDEFLMYNTFSLDDLEIFKAFHAIMGYREVDTEEVTKDLRRYIRSFPTKKKLLEGLEKGYLRYDEFVRGEELKCPNYEAFKIVKERGFDSYTEYEVALENGFQDKKTMKEALHRKCENYSELVELRKFGGELTYPEYQDIVQVGFKSYKQYLTATEKGFNDFNTWKIAVVNGIPNYTEYEELIRFGVLPDESSTDLYIHYQKAKEAGYPNFQTYLLASSKGFSSYDGYIEAEKLGFDTYADMVEANGRGFSSHDEMKRIENLGFKTLREYQEAEERGCETMGQLEFINENGFKTWEDYQDSIKRGFPDSTFFYLAVEQGVETYSEYRKMHETGFSSYAEYREAIANGFLTKEHYEEAKKKGAKDSTTLDLIDEGGFPTFQEFEKARRMGIHDYETYLNAEKIGAPDLATYEAMTNGRFNNFETYKLAEEQGFPDVDSYTAAKKLLAANYKEYVILTRVGLTKREYIDKMIKLLKEKDELYNKIKSIFEESKVVRSSHTKDFYTLKKTREYLGELLLSIDKEIRELEINNFDFQELYEYYAQTIKNFTTLLEDINNYATEVNREYKPLQIFVDFIKDYKVPAVLTMNQLLSHHQYSDDELQELNRLLRKYFRDNVKLDFENQSIEYKKWIASPEQLKEYKGRIRKFILGLKKGSVIGIGYLKDTLEFPGTNSQFNEIIEDINAEDQEIIMADFSVGILSIPSLDYFEENFAFEELKESIMEILERFVINSQRNVRITTIASEIGHPTPTPAFIRALNQCLESFPNIKFNQEEGLLSPPIPQKHSICTLCALTIDKGQRIGECIHCNSQFHYRELEPYVLDQKKCPKCGQELFMEEVYSMIVL